MKGIIKTFISYSHEDEEAVTQFIARGAPFGVTPWRDKNDLMPVVGHSMDEEIRKALLGGDIAAITLFLSEKSYNSDWVKKEIYMAHQAGKHVIPVVLDDHNEQVEKQLKEWLKPENPYYLKATDPMAPSRWISTIIKEVHADMASDVALYLGYRDSAIGPSVLPESWSGIMPVLDLRSPECRLDQTLSRDFRSWNPGSEEKYAKIEGAISFLRRFLTSTENVYVTGLAPLGIAGMIGKYWDRGSGPVQIISWNTYGEEEWRVKRENPSDDWSPETGKHLELIEQRDMDGGSNLLIGHFRRQDQFKMALDWSSTEQKDEMRLGKALCLGFPEKITAENAGEVAMECARSFAWARKIFRPQVIYWFAGLPLALMPLATHLARATGRIVFMDENKQKGDYIKAFELR